MNPVFNMDAATLSPVALFLQADWVVKAVMLGLLAASVFHYGQFRIAEAKAALGAAGWPVRPVPEAREAA